MPFLECGNARFHYEEHGQGEPLLTLHGLSENTTYWNVAGFSDPFAQDFRFVSVDMRAHGRTRVSGESPGYDVETMGDDIDRVADALGLDRFHLLTHSTGGMVASRYAMRNTGRLRSLVLTNSSSATALLAGTDAEIRAAYEPLAQFFEGRSWDVLLPLMRAAGGPLLGGLNDHPDPDRVWALAGSMFRIGDPDALGAFCRSFYRDPDPNLEGLRGIECPTLVLVGENDAMFYGPGEQMANEIPNARHVVLPGIGHMTAIEAPEATAGNILEFLRDTQRRAS